MTARCTGAVELGSLGAAAVTLYRNSFWVTICLQWYGGESWVTAMSLLFVQTKRILSRGYHITHCRTRIHAFQLPRRTCTKTICQWVMEGLLELFYLLYVGSVMEIPGPNPSAVDTVDGWAECHVLGSGTSVESFMLWKPLGE